MSKGKIQFSFKKLCMANEMGGGGVEVRRVWRKLLDGGDECVYVVDWLKGEWCFYRQSLHLNNLKGIFRTKGVSIPKMKLRENGRRKKNRKENEIKRERKGKKIDTLPNIFALKSIRHSKLNEFIILFMKFECAHD